MQGNGDYISREETLKRLCKAACNVPNCECDRVRCPEWFAIHDAPAADVRPVVTGKFYLQYNGDGCWHCSECNYQARYPSNFCPNCGADMRPEPPKEE